MNSNQSLAAYIGWMLLLAAFGLYAYVVIAAILNALNGTVDSKTYPEFLTAATASIQALLLTNLGIVLGIAVSNPGAPIGRALLLSSNAQINAPVAPMDIKEKIQIVSVLIYLTSILSMTVVWAIIGFETNPTKVISLIPESAKAFVGVTLAYVATILAK